MIRSLNTPRFSNVDVCHIAWAMILLVWLSDEPVIELRFSAPDPFLKGERKIRVILAAIACSFSSHFRLPLARALR